DRSDSGGTPNTLEGKLAILAQCGFRLAPPFEVDDLLESWDREEYEQKGYDTVLVGLGMTEEQEPWRNHCANLWHFDTECIEDHGAYKQIVERMSEMAQGSLALGDIQDYVDIEEGKAWVSFVFQGKHSRINCEVNDDWVDPQIFGAFDQLLKQS